MIDWVQGVRRDLRAGHGRTVCHTRHQCLPGILISLISMQLHTAPSQADARCLPLEKQYVIIMLILQVIKNKQLLLIM